jgi:hypothetical protein
MTRKHRKTFELIFAYPSSARVKWRDIEALFRELGAEVTEREGSRVGVRLFGERRMFHRPHASPDTDKGAVTSIRKWFKMNGQIKPSPFPGVVRQGGNFGQCVGKESERLDCGCYPSYR